MILFPGGGHAWLLGGVWLLGGMHGCQGSVRGSWGVCMVAGGTCMVAGDMRSCQGGVHGSWGVHGCWGACMVARGQWAYVVARGMCGCQGALCMVAGGHMWLPGAYMASWQCVANGACMVKGDMWAKGGGMRGKRGACVAKGACVVKGGACMAKGGVHGEGVSMCGIQRDTEIRSMSGRYASYWNAFLCFIYMYNNLTVSVFSQTCQSGNYSTHLGILDPHHTTLNQPLLSLSLFV